MEKLACVLFFMVFVAGKAHAADNSSSLRKATFAGGKKVNPTYQEVSSGTSGHREAVQVTYDPSVITYQELLDIFWRQIDPTDDAGQFVDEGSQYRSAILYHDDEQKKLAQRSREELAASGRFERPIVTEILPATTFYKAEEYHQDYHRKNPVAYQSYRTTSGRDQFLAKVWGEEEKKAKDSKKMDSDELKKKLTSLQYEVTQCSATEPPFQNEYWNNKREGIYVDVVSGKPLFRSKDKFDSGTGWPSFTRPLSDEEIVEKEDTSLSMTRTEVRGKDSEAHLGHLFNDGPGPTGLRYCINSAALRFIPKENLRAEGYGEYEGIFRE